MQIYFEQDPHTNDTVTYAMQGDRLFLTISFSDRAIVRRPERLLTLAAAAVNGTVIDACRSLTEQIDRSTVRGPNLLDLLNTYTPEEADRDTREYFGGVEAGYVGTEVSKL